MPPATTLGHWRPQDWPIAADWQPVVDAFLASPQGLELGHFMARRIAAGAQIYPPMPFRALELCALADVRLVILGQDPYHGPGQAEGLAFSVAPGVALPPSLRNIFKELARDLGQPLPAKGGQIGQANGSLVCWAQQGVLLLNTCLTVERGQPASHANQGWEPLTDVLLGALASRAATPCAYLLWGAHAQAKAALIERVCMAHAIDPRYRLILRANHPSPLSALRPPLPFIGCGHFSAARDWLAAQGHALQW